MAAGVHARRLRPSHCLDAGNGPIAGFGEASGDQGSARTSEADVPCRMAVSWPSAPHAPAQSAQQHYDIVKVRPGKPGEKAALGVHRRGRGSLREEENLGMRRTDDTVLETRGACGRADQRR